MRKIEAADDLDIDALRSGPGMYTPTEVARLLRIHPRTVLNWVHAGRLDAIKLSERVYRIPRATLVKQLFPDRVSRLPVRRSGRMPMPGRGERLGKKFRTKVPA